VCGIFLFSVNSVMGFNLVTEIKPKIVYKFLFPNIIQHELLANFDKFGSYRWITFLVCIPF
jgi:hypothetical protein